MEFFGCLVREGSWNFPRQDRDFKEFRGSGEGRLSLQPKQTHCSRNKKLVRGAWGCQCHVGMRRQVG